MIKQPYFMSNKDWYTTNENDELILTKLAPQKAVEDYNSEKTKFIAKMKNITNEEYLDFVMSEDSWYIFPM